MIVLSACSPSNRNRVRTGLDRIEEYRSLLDGKRIGIITNHTAVNTRGKHITDVFFSMDNVEVVALFGPEHGIRGDEAAGGDIPDEEHPTHNIPVYSLYGKTQKPTDAMLKNIDALVYDIQDIGARFYTYVSTMALAMEAAAENGIHFIVLDRPNPIGGRIVEGNLLAPEFASFVGMYPIPVRHGLTAGELATMFNAEGWLAGGVRAELTVIECRDWVRHRWFDETGLTWIQTSPNMPTLDVATVYPGTCLFEGTNVSEGRGTDTPFLQIGAPWLDPYSVLTELEKMHLPGVEFKANVFTPVSIPGKAPHPKYEGEMCRGIRLMVLDRETYRSYDTGIGLLIAIKRVHPELLAWREGHFDRLCGTDRIRKMILDRASLSEIEDTWLEEYETFLQMREKYLLYR